MISYEMIVQQIAKLTAQANEAQNEQQIREQLSAIRALCDVVLSDQTASTKDFQATQNKTNFVNLSSPTPVYTQPVVMPSQKLEEDDANGDSIFDF